MNRQWAIVQYHADSEDRPHVFGPYKSETAALEAMSDLEELLNSRHALTVGLIYNLEE